MRQDAKPAACLLPGSPGRMIAERKRVAEHFRSEGGRRSSPNQRRTRAGSGAHPVRSVPCGSGNPRKSGRPGDAHLRRRPQPGRLVLWLHEKHGDLREECGCQDDFDSYHRRRTAQILRTGTVARERRSMTCRGRQVVHRNQGQTVLAKMPWTITARSDNPVAI